MPAKRHPPRTHALEDAAVQVVVAQQLVAIGPLALFALLAILVLGLTHFPLFHPAVAMIFWCALGVCAAQRSDRSGGGT